MAGWRSDGRLVIGGRIQIQFQPGIRAIAELGFARPGLQEFPQGLCRGRWEGRPGGGGQDDRVPSFAEIGGLADRVGMCEGELQHGGERGHLELGLITQGNNPVRQTGDPALPTGGALDGTEHAFIRMRIEDAIRDRAAEPIQLLG